MIKTRVILDRIHRLQGAHKRKFLQERRYTLPKDGDQVMFDWYALYTLWFQLGSGKETHGYQRDQPINDARVKAIDSTFEEATRQLAGRMVGQLQLVIYEELLNIYDKRIIPRAWFLTYAQMVGGPFLKIWQDQYKYTSSTPVLFDSTFWSRYTYDDLIKLFDPVFWNKYVDMYGGKPWQEAVVATMRLHNALKTGNMFGANGLVKIIDEIYDMHHNMGLLLAKTDLIVDEKYLDFRAEARSIRDFLPYVSKYPKELITAQLLDIPESLLEFQRPKST